MAAEPDYSQIIVAKAARVADLSMARRSLPTNRLQIEQHLRHVRAQLRRGDIAICGSCGFSQTGLRIYFESIGASSDEADMLAGAAAEIATHLAN